MEQVLNNGERCSTGARSCVNALTTDSANSRKIVGNALMHGQEEAVFADAGYTGADRRPE